MKFLATLAWFISLVACSILFVSLLAAFIHFLWNGENEKVTLHLLAELAIFWLISAVVTYVFAVVRNGIGYERRIRKTDYRYSKREAAQPNVPFNI